MNLFKTRLIGGILLKRVKRLLSLGIMLSSVSLALVGCGTDTTGGTGDTGGDKKYIVGTDATYAPMEYMDDKGNIVGTDIDIIKALAKELDIEVEFKNYGWEPLFTAVSNEEVDFAVSSITITDERKETYDFSNP